MRTVQRAPLERGGETDLEHGGGLGLWTAHWGVTRMGGELAVEENTPRGSTVTVSVPRGQGPTDAGDPTLVATDGGRPGTG